MCSRLNPKSTRQWLISRHDSEKLNLAPTTIPVTGVESECFRNNGYQVFINYRFKLKVKNNYSPKSFYELYLNEDFPEPEFEPTESPPKKKRVPWNKGLTKATDPRIAKGEEKKQKTNLAKYGVANVFQSAEVKAKVDPLRQSGELAKRAMDTKELRYGDANYNNTEKNKQTKLDRYGDANYNNREGARDTNIQKYGVAHHNQVPEIKNKISITRIKNNSHEKAINTIIREYGSLDNYWQAIYDKKRANGTLGNYESSDEKALYAKLVSKYGENDIIKQHFDKDRYPFKCDFYIKSEDKFIELHGTYLHGPHPFDPTNPDDVAWLNVLKEKAKTSPQAKSYIYTWTDLDVRKLETAKKNNLNYEAIYCKTHY